MKKDLLIKVRQVKPPETLGEKVQLCLRSFWGVFLMYCLRIRHRAFLLMARPLMVHLEKDIFPELVSRRYRWLVITCPAGEGANGVLSAFAGDKEYFFPGTDLLAKTLMSAGLRRIRLNTNLEYNQILDVLLLFIYVKKFVGEGAVLPEKPCENRSWGRKNMAACMLSGKGLHRFCAEIRQVVPMGMLEVDYSYCEPMMARFVKNMVKTRNAPGGHRVFFQRAPAVSLGAWGFFALPLVLQGAGFDIVSGFLFALSFVVPFFVWILMFTAGSILYEKEHDELLKFEHARQHKILSRFPETNPNPIIKVGTDGEIKYANPAAHNLAWVVTGKDNVEDILPGDYMEYTGNGCPEQDFHVEVRVRKRFFRYHVSGFSEDCSVIFAGSDITDLRNTESKLRDLNEGLERLVEKRTGELLGTQDAAIICLAGLAEVRDPETGEHIERTRDYVRVLAEKLAESPAYKQVLTREVIVSLYKSAPLHDIGKVGIPDAILNKPGKLTEEEFEIMKKHTEYGAQTLELAVKKLGYDSFLNIAGEIALNHHERWDGSGYPRGISGDEIPISARLMALADEYDALVSRRVYKEPFSHEKAVRIISSKRGTHYDPDVVDAFLAVLDSFVEISFRFSDQQLRPRQVVNDTPSVIPVLP